MPKKTSKVVSRKPASRKKKPTVANILKRPSSPVFFSYSDYQNTLRSIKVSYALFKLRTTVKSKAVLASLNTKAQREVTFFQDSSFPVTFKPFLYKQGLAVFLFLFILTSIILPSPTIDKSLVIDTAVTKQNTTVVADGNPIKWTVMVKKSDITNSKYLLSLPKSAKNIKVSTISQQQADTIIQSTKVEQVSQKQRQNIARSNQPKSFYAAAILDNMGEFMLSSLDNVVQAVVDATNDQIQTTDDAVVVDLSSEVSAETPEEPAQSPADNEAGEPPVVEEAPVITEAPVEETPAPETPASVIDTPEAIEDFGEAIQVSDLPDITETTSPSDETPIVEIPIDPVIQPGAELNGSANSSSETAVEAPSDDGARNDYVAITYETAAPIVTEQNTDTGKVVTVSSDEKVQDPAEEQVPLTDVLAFTNIPEIYKVGQEDKIKIKWSNNNDQNVIFKAYDLNNNGKLDYVEWIVPHLSVQTFEIIFISKAFQLDANKEILADIYDTVKTQDGNYVTITDGQYIRVTFEKTLTNQNDITIYAKPTNSGDPVTINAYTTDTEQLVATFFIDKEGRYQQLIPDLASPTDVFDLQIIGNVDIDYIVDPVCATAPDNPLYTVCTYTTVGETTFTPPAGVTTVSVLVVAGGGAGGGSFGAGGGGGGGVVFASGHAVTAGSIGVTVGAGGLGKDIPGSPDDAIGGDGGDSSFGTLTANGGGGGGFRDGGWGPIPANDGGSGGGGGADGAGGSATQSSGSGYTGYGNDGGNGVYPNAAGGGGAGAVGGIPSGGNTAGNGGAGIDMSSFVGTSIGASGWFSGGGGGSTYWSNWTPGTGANGGGDGSYNDNGATVHSAAANTGSGGGGGTNSPSKLAGGDGGSGIVIVRYLTPANLGDGLVAHYTMNDNAASATVVDSVGSNNGTAQQFTNILTTAKVDRALSFNGTTDYVSVADSNNLDVGDIFTISVWAKKAVNGVGETLVSKFNGGYEMGIWSDNLVYVAKSNVNFIAFSTTAITDTNWHLISWSKNGSANNIYIDGSNVTGTVSDLTLTDTSTSLRVGKQDSSLFFNGSLDDVRIYNSVLTQTDVDAIYNGGAGSETAVLTGLVAHYGMNDNAVSTTVVDSIGSNNGTAQQNTDVLTSSKIGGALTFNGTSDYVGIGSSPSTNFSNSSFTISAWIYLNSLTGLPDIAARWIGGKQYKLVASDGTGKPYLDVSTTGDNDIYRVSSVAIEINRWAHVVGIYNGTDLQIYINGSLSQGTLTGVVSSPLYGNPANLYIGGGVDNNPFNGSMDDVRIYNTALSADDILTLYNNGAGAEGQNVTPNVPTLVSPANASYTTDNTPTLSAYYLDPDSGGTGTTNYRIDSSASDCVLASPATLVTSGTSASVANPNNTTWTPASTIGTDATYYWCAQNNDGSATSAWTQMGSFTLDTATPTITLTSPTDSSVTGSSVNFNVSATDANAFSIIPKLDSSLVSWFRMEDNAGNANVTDYMGTHNGSASRNTSLTSTAGKFGKAMSFNGAGDYFDAGSGSDLNFGANDFSVSLWVKTSDTMPAWGTEISKGNPILAAPSWALMSTSNSNIHFRVRDTSAMNEKEADITAQEWTHVVALRYSDATHDYADLYINGVKSGSTVSTSKINVDTTDDLVLGVNQNWFKGSLDDVMIFNRKLTTDEITALFNGSAISHSSTLAGGSHTYKAYAQDLAGNVGQSSADPITFTVDTTDPTSTISTPTNNSYSASTTVALTGTSADETSLASTTISVDGGDFVATGGTAGAWTYSATGLSKIAHTFQTKATDSAGNTGLSSVVTVTVDTTDPTITVTSPTSGTYYNSTSVPFYASTTDTNKGNIVPNLDSSLVSWWTMDSVTGSTLTDYMGNNNGTITGATQATGKFGRGMIFNGTSDVIEIANSSSLNVGTTTTWSSWVYPTSFDDHLFHTVIAKSFSTGYWFGLYQIEGKIQLWAGGSNAVSSGAVPLNQWSLITATWDGLNVRFYINGVLDSTVAKDGNASINATFAHIGADYSLGESGVLDYNFTGSLDDVMIFNRALEPEEITALYDGTTIDHAFTLTQASHTYKAYAQDLAGNVLASDLATFTVDTTNPTSTISTPATNSYSNSTTVALTGTSADETSLVSTTISVDGGDFVATSGTAGAWTYSATGSHKLHTLSKLKPPTRPVIPDSLRSLL